MKSKRVVEELNKVAKKMGLNWGDIPPQLKYKSLKEELQELQLRELLDNK